jgi:hypothetical protein
MLDPQRIGLNAESVGFLKRTHQEVDWHAFKTAMQTEYNNQNSAVDVRRLKETPVSEIHVMGGERNGFASNELLLTQARQQRQLNGYPLRSFSASNPAVVLPKKYGGFPLYNRNQVEYPEFVSVFTEPMSAPLQSDATLMPSRAGELPKTVNSLHNPYEENYFMDPMAQSYDAMEANANEFAQRRHLQGMSAKSKRQRNVGVFISSSGQPISTVQDSAASAMATQGAFALNASNHSSRQSQQQQHLVHEEQDYDNLSTMSDLTDKGSSAPTEVSSSLGSSRLARRLARSFGKASAALHTEGDESVASVRLIKGPATPTATVLSHRSDERTVKDVEDELTEPEILMPPSNHSPHSNPNIISDKRPEWGVEKTHYRLKATSSHATTGNQMRAASTIVKQIRKYQAASLLSKTIPAAIYLPQSTGPITGMQPQMLQEIREMKNAQGRKKKTQRPNSNYDLGRARGPTSKRDIFMAATRRNSKIRERAQFRENRDFDYLYNHVYGIHGTILG